MVITIFIILLSFYTYFIYKNGYNFISVFFLFAFGIAFLLPVSLGVFDNFGYVFPNKFYDSLNVYYLMFLLLFIISNFLTIYMSKNTIEKKKNIIKVDNIIRIIKIYMFILLTLFLFLGTESIVSGSGHLIHINPIISMLLPSSIYGSIFFTGLFVIMSNGKSSKYIGILLFIFTLFFGLSFTFGRRIVIYPLISLAIIYIILKKRKPNFFVLISIILVGLFFIMPLMMNIRTFGLTNGFTHLMTSYTNVDELKKYIALSTDVSVEYSLAALIIATNIKTSPLTLFKPILIFIPRSIWPDKPIPLSEHLVKDLGLSKISFMSIPPGIIGELFTYFSIIGIIFGSIFWGYVVGRADRKIFINKNEVNESQININSILIVCFFIQFITSAIRGDTATGLQESLYIFIPMYLLLKLSKFRFKIN